MLPVARFRRISARFFLFFSFSRDWIGNKPWQGAKEGTAGRNKGAMGQWVSRARVGGIVLRCFYRARSWHIHQSTLTDKTMKSKRDQRERKKSFSSTCASIEEILKRRDQIHHGRILYSTVISNAYDKLSLRYSFKRWNDAVAANCKCCRFDHHLWTCHERVQYLQ